MSSSRIASASAIEARLDVGDRQVARARATSSIRWTAQARLTAVGRVRMSWSPTAPARRGTPDASVCRIVRAPRASPMAAAMPMAGAPRTCMVRMAWATSSTVPHSR